MDCPQCGSRLAFYRLFDRESFVCERCGYVGIEAEHRAENPDEESWDEALERFRRRAIERGDEEPPDPGVDAGQLVETGTDTGTRARRNGQSDGQVSVSKAVVSADDEDTAGEPADEGGTDEELESASARESNDGAEDGVGGGGSSSEGNPTGPSFPRDVIRGRLEGRTVRGGGDDASLYEIATDLDIVGRSSMAKAELIEAILDEREARFETELTDDDTDEPGGDHED